MNYQEVCEEFKKGIISNKEWNVKADTYRFYPDGYTAKNKEERDFIRETNEKYHRIKSDVLKGDFVTFMIARGEDELVQSRYALKDIYTIYQKDGWDGVWKLIESHMKMLKPFKIRHITEIFDSYENAKDKLLIRAINFTDNEARLTGYIYKQIGDVALVLYVVLYDDDRGFGSAKLPKTTIEKWGKEVEQLFEEALQNTVKLMPPRLYANLWDALVNHPRKGTFMDEDAKELRMEEDDVPMIKTTKQINGAIAMFYPGVKERIAEMFGGSYYVTFTSIHEARAHLVGSMPLQEIKESLDRVNEEFSEQEILSREVFLYNEEEKTFNVVEI